MELIIKHQDGSKDNRYTFTSEFLGYSVPMLAVRFCGDLIGACSDKGKALHVAETHQRNRN